MARSIPPGSVTELVAHIRDVYASRITGERHARGLPHAAICRPNILRSSAISFKIADWVSSRRLKFQNRWVGRMNIDR